MNARYFFADIDAICGKDLLENNITKVRVTRKMTRFFKKLHEQNIKIVLCGWDHPSMGECEELRAQFDADDTVILPFYTDDNASFLPVLEKFHTTAEDVFYAASNPKMKNRALDWNIKTVQIHISNPIALDRMELCTEKDNESRQQFDVLYRKASEFFKLN